MVAKDDSDVPSPADERRVTGQQWRWSVLAGMAYYLDAGSIVAISVSLTTWQKSIGLTAGMIGVLAALGPNAIGCAVGSVIGGRLGDLLGRKRIYQYDLLVYALGVLIIALAVNSPMLMIGTVVVGLAVGADVPVSSALIGEFAPAKARGRLFGFSTVAWNTGPIIVLLLGLVTGGLGTWMPRIVFASLFVVSLATYLLRQGMLESARWRQATASTRSQLSELLDRRHLRSLVWTAAIYVFWGLAAGTGGIFTPYIVTTLNAGSQSAGVALQAGGFLIGILAMVFIFMPNSDRGYRARRALWGVGSLMQLFAYGIYLFLPFTIPTVIVNIVVYGIGAALAGDAMYKIFSQELFPTMVRSSAQGFTFGIARLCLGIWSFFVPILATAGIRPVAAVLTAFITASGLIGFIWMPRTAGRPLEDIERDLQPTRPSPQETAS